MAIKTYQDIYNDVCHRLKIAASNTNEINDVKNWVNLAYRDFQIKSNWYWRKKTGILQIIPFYETGSIEVTNGSRTITGNSTVWTSAMEGRYIQVSGESPYYKIIKVTNNTSLIIDQPYVDDTKSIQSYKIWKRFYNLPPDVDEIINIHTDLSCGGLDSESFYEPFTNGSPSKYKKTGIDNTVTTYTTGTVSGSVNTRTVTGAGTSWIANVQIGDLFTPVGGSTYNVLSVDSDTQLTLVQNLKAAITASDTYTIQRQDLIQLEFNATPTETMNVYFDYLKRTFDMINDNDEPEIPLQYRDILIDGTIPTTNQYLSLEGGELKQQFTLQKYNNRVDDIKNKISNESNEPSGFYFED